MGLTLSEGWFLLIYKLMEGPPPTNIAGISLLDSYCLTAECFLRKLARHVRKAPPHRTVEHRSVGHGQLCSYVAFAVGFDNYGDIHLVGEIKRDTFLSY